MNYPDFVSGNATRLCVNNVYPDGDCLSGRFSVATLESPADWLLQALSPLAPVTISLSF